MFDDLRRERQVRCALRAIARQRVVMVLNPGGVQVVEKSPPNQEWFEVGIRTCHIRGWVEVLHESLPTGSIQMQGRTPLLPAEMTPMTHYRITEGGWAMLNRSHGWVMATFVTSGFGLVAGLASLAVDFLSLPAR